MLKDGFSGDRQKWQCAITERVRQARLYEDPDFAEHKRHAMRVIYNSGGGERRKLRYWERKDRGVCTRCQGPLLSDAFCWNCLNDLAEQSVLTARRKRGWN